VTPVLYVRGDANDLFTLEPAHKPATGIPKPPGDWRNWSTRRRAMVAGLAAVVAGVLIAGILVAVNRTDNAEAKLLSIGRSEVNLGDLCAGQKGWAFPQSIDSLPWAYHVNDEGWVAKYGGVPVSGNYYAFTLSALTSDSVVIEGVDPEVISRAEPVRGVYPAPWTGGCGGILPSVFRVNVDNTPVSVNPVAGDNFGMPIPPVPLPHRIDYNQPEVWHVAAVTETCNCEWVARVRWRSGDRTGVITLDDNGKPFRVTSTTLTTTIDNDDGRLPRWRVTAQG
jgi:hypothetical protein